ncbi:MAG: response regulator transcription factor [Bacteroidia bacterium]|nr:response regulator transcription factor [Bacteroidia bacterium]
MSKISVGIIDDHQAIAKGLSLELNASGKFEVLFTVLENSEIIDALRTHAPDVLLMDVVMPGSMGTDNFKEVLRAFPNQKIIAYTALNSPVMIELLFKSGVKGYVNKNQDMGDVKLALEEVFYDRLYLPAEYDFIRKKIKYSQVPDELSKREIEILNLIAQEKTTPEIAGLLNISVNTIETHRKHLFEKLEVSNLAGLIKAGFERGYLH